MTRGSDRFELRIGVVELQDLHACRPAPSTGKRGLARLLLRPLGHAQQQPGLAGEAEHARVEQALDLHARDARADVAPAEGSGFREIVSQCQPWLSLPITGVGAGNSKHRRRSRLVTDIVEQPGELDDVQRSEQRRLDPLGFRITILARPQDLGKFAGADRVAHEHFDERLGLGHAVDQSVRTPSRLLSAYFV